MSSSFEAIPVTRPVSRPIGLRQMAVRAVRRALRRALAVDLRYVDPWERKRR